MARRKTELEAYLGVAYKSPEEDVLRLLIELGAQFVGAREGSLLVLDEKRRELVFAMTVGDGSSKRSLVGQCVPLGKGITGLAAQTREVQIGAPTFGMRQSKEPFSVLAAPMLVGDRLIGVITAVSLDRRKRFNGADAMFYGRIAAVAAVLVEQRRKLSVVEAVREGRPLPKGVGEEDRLDREIVGCVRKIVKSRPHAKRLVARLLSEIQSLLSE